jgi:hypothetical protein
MHSHRSDWVAKVRLPGDVDSLQFWRWLVGADAEPLLVTALGDVFVTAGQGQVLFLDTYEGTFVEVAPSEAMWRPLLGDPQRQVEWFNPSLVQQLRERGLCLADGQSYSPVHPLVLGGSMEPENFEVAEWLVHVGLMGQLHEKTRELPEGTRIRSFRTAE